MGMQSRMYAVARVDKGNKKLGLIVLESKDPARFPVAEVRSYLEALCKEVAPLLVSIDTYTNLVANKQRNILTS